MRPCAVCVSCIYTSSLYQVEGCAYNVCIGLQMGCHPVAVVIMHAHKYEVK